ncbi:coenzyme F420-0:L-glutamate ligase [Candidatus Collierbacteria bacterium]|nr:coenzyme F420-0:L-glutamate ligase [Candidatus Collierbacteria bacterium]
MLVTPVKTSLVRSGDDILEILAKSIKILPEKSVVVIASKIFSLCENRIVKKISGAKEEKHELVKREAEYYLDPHSSKYNMMLTVKGSWMFVNAGIDESNSENKYSLWPKDPQKSINNVWRFLRRHYHLKKVGAIMSDSRSFPLNWGVVGHGIAHCGFKTLKSYIGKSDLFGRLMKMEQVNMVQGITAAAVLEMGEGAEQTPIAIVTNVSDILFQNHVPSKQGLSLLHINLEDDVYAPILLAAKWKKGGGGNHC